MPTDSHLANTTLTYWYLSSIFRNRIPGGISTIEGLQGCNLVIASLGPDRRTRHVTQRLLNDIVRGRSIPTNNAPQILAAVKL